MRLRMLDRILLGTVGLGLVASLAATGVDQTDPNVTRLVRDLVLWALFAWVLLFVGRYVWGQAVRGVFATEALVLDSTNRLLLYQHPFHKRLLPPGGRLRRHEPPHEGLERHLKERIGLKPDKYMFESLVPKPVAPAVLDHVERVPAPFLVQKEKRPQRFFRRFHVDFIYVLRTTATVETFLDNEYSPRWVTADELQALDGRKEIYPDVLNAYNYLIENLP